MSQTDTESRIRAILQKIYENQTMTGDDWTEFEGLIGSIPKGETVYACPRCGKKLKKTSSSLACFMGRSEGCGDSFGRPIEITRVL
jgi:uncharacterized C2H2 Zn-finger protein